MSRLKQRWQRISIAVLLLIAIGLGAVVALRIMTPTKATVKLVNGPVTIVNGQDRRAAKAGDTFSPMTTSGGDLIETAMGSAALVLLPNGSTVELGGSSSMWYFTGLSERHGLPITLHGSGTLTVPARVRLVIYSGSSVTTVDGPANFAETVAGNHGDVYLRVTKGSVTATSTESLGAVTGHAGESVVLKGPRGA